MLTIPRSALSIPADRQRGTISATSVAELADSIEKHSLLHPPVVRDLGAGAFELIAGETRLRAIDFLADTGVTFRCGDEQFPPGTLPVTPLSELTPLQVFEVELEENIRRTPLPWQREVEATAKLHRLKLAAGLSRRAALQETAATMVALTGTGDPRLLATVQQAVLLDEHRNDPAIAKAASRTEAVKILAKKLSKNADAAIAPVGTDLTSFLNEDFRDVLPRLDDASFDAIISDPPYGIGIRQFSTQSSSEQEYDDSPEHWTELMDALFEELPRVLKPNASGFLFCDFTRFSDLAARAASAGFEVYPRPFIWDRTPDGRLTTPDKWPRRVYECILYFRRGDRALHEIRNDVLRYPADRSQDNYHGAKKPEALFIDLCERIVRPGDAVLDPFAGSGVLSRAARTLNLRHLSIEKDAAYYGLMLRLYGDGK